MAGKANKEKGLIVHPGMGGFLNPPTHPEHDWHVETDLRRRPENRGGMSLSAAVDATWLDPATRAEAKKLLKSWQPPSPSSPEITDWRQQVLGYFRGCYRNPGSPDGEWNASNLVIDQNRDPIANADDHAGVHLIREFYPDYVPTEDNFGGAYWGSKPERAMVHERYTRTRRRHVPHAGRGRGYRARYAREAAERDFSMTYGQLPPFEQFMQDIRRPDPDHPGKAYWPSGELYSMELVTPPEIELAEAFGLEEFRAERARTHRRARVQRQREGDLRISRVPLRQVEQR